VGFTLTKFLKILKRHYVVIPDPLSSIKSLIDYFHVPKAKDICPVCNGASCGINGALWSPNFWLLTAKSALCVLDFNYFCVDINLGKFFLNFLYPAWLCQYSGIDLTPYADILAGLDFQLRQDTNRLYRHDVGWDASPLLLSWFAIIIGLRNLSGGVLETQRTPCVEITSS
jgi:hypothetical protein